MIVLRCIGVFVFILGLLVMLADMKLKEGEESWNSKHNIKVPPYVSLSLLLIGFILVFATAFNSSNNSSKSASVENTETTEVDTESTEVNTELSTEGTDEATTGDNTTDETVIVEDTETNLLTDVEASIATGVNYISTSGSEDDIITLPFYSSVALNLSGLEYQLSDYVLYIKFDNNTNVSYSDSYVEIGDTSAVSSQFELILDIYKDDLADTEHGAIIRAWSINGTTDNYSMYIETTSGYNKLWAYQNVGDDTYLSMEATDYSGNLTEEEMINMSILALQ